MLSTERDSFIKQQNATFLQKLSIGRVILKLIFDIQTHKTKVIVYSEMYHSKISQ